MLQERLKEQRRALGVTQAELAGLLGVSARAVYMWEAGERKPDIGMLIRLVKVFSVSADYLLGLRDEPQAAQPAAPQARITADEPASLREGPDEGRARDGKAISRKADKANQDPELDTWLL